MRILGTGSALPKRVVKNEELTQFVDTSDEWIKTRTGISTRRVITTETLEELGAQAAKNALENAGLSANDLDLIICSTVQGDQITPALGCLIQRAIGAKCPAFDLNAACPGFEYALDVAESYIASGRARNILVVSSESVSYLCNWTDRSTRVLFGDGAGAAVVGQGGDYLSSHFVCEGGDEVLRAPMPNGNSPFTQRPVSWSGLYMNGPEVYKFAVAGSIRDIRTVVEQAGITMDEVGHFVLHQANLRIIEAVRTRLKQPKEKFPHNIEHYGNTSSASVPILLDELNRAGALQKGEIVVLSAFGAGLCTGACAIRWSK